MSRALTLDDFDYNLPPERIAQHPATPRESAKLLRVHGDHLTHHTIADLPQLLQPGDQLVFNNSLVIPARLLGHRGQAKVELLLHQQASDASIPPHEQHWQAFARPAKRLKLGDQIDFAADFAAEVIAKHENGLVSVRFAENTQNFWDKLNRYGQPPLPPYIKRESGPTASDPRDYQTIYADAKQPGSVAAPTAGLHFTAPLLAALQARGCDLHFVTLHVGAGTFLPVKVDNIAEHQMHSEWASLSAATAAALQAAKAKGQRIVAVGTTSLRTLESAAQSGTIQPFHGATNLFVRPGFTFHAADLLLTNFHLPRSTLLMLVAAFVGLERIKHAYDHAIANQYRFYSYGDACLLSHTPTAP